MDASVKANIQHAATKITNIEDWILRLRLFSLTNYYFNIPIAIIDNNGNVTADNSVVITKISDA